MKAIMPRTQALSGGAVPAESVEYLPQKSPSQEALKADQIQSPSVQLELSDDITWTRRVEQKNKLNKLLCQVRNYLSSLKTAGCSLI